MLEKIWVNYGDTVCPSTLDYPGKASLVLYMRGCPMRCPYCSNHKFLAGGNWWPIEAIEEQIRLAPVDAIVFSGGEPLMQPEALYRLANYAHSEGKFTGLQTNGLYVDRFIDMLTVDHDGVVRSPFDAVMLDLKGSPVSLYMDEDWLPRTASRAYDDHRSGHPYVMSRACQGLREKNALTYFEVRTTAYPGVADEKREIRRIVQNMGTPDVYVIQQGRPELSRHAELRDKQPVPIERLLRLARTAKQHLGCTVKIRSVLGEEEVQC